MRTPVTIVENHPPRRVIGRAAARTLATLCGDRGGAVRTGGREPPAVLVPTTAGTGCEATVAGILTAAAGPMKVDVVDPHLPPDIAFVAPDVTADRPVLSPAGA